MNRCLRHARASLTSGRVVMTVALLASSACTRDTPPGSAAQDAQVAPQSAVDASPSSSPVGARDASTSEAGEAAQAEVHDAGASFGRARALGGASIGNTSVAYKLKLEGGLVAAWKPDSRRGKDRYRGEIAARRLGVALGLPNVPEAMLRGFTKAELRGVLTGDALALLESEALENARGIVPGALIPWIHGLTFPPLHAEPLASRWKRGIASADLSDAGTEELAFLADMSTVVAFDTITGNWDRWSGGNLGKDPATGRILFVDNDGAFFARPPPDGIERQRTLLAATRRFSRSFVAALRAIDVTKLAAVLGEDLDGRPLIGAKALAGVQQRLVEVRRAIDATDGGAGLP